jgi:hypothetical protein
MRLKAHWYMQRKLTTSLKIVTKLVDSVYIWVSVMAGGFVNDLTGPPWPYMVRNYLDWEFKCFARFRNRQRASRAVELVVRVDEQQKVQAAADSQCCEVKPRARLKWVPICQRSSGKTK